MAKRAKKVPEPVSPPPSAEVQAEINRRLSMPYSYELIPEGDGTWFIRIVEFPGCMSVGNDVEDAMRMIRDAAQGWLEVGIEDGDPIPEPVSIGDFSGRFLTRIPPSLHRDLVRRADREGVSLNLFVATALARALGQA